MPITLSPDDHMTRFSKPDIHPLADRACALFILFLPLPLFYWMIPFASPLMLGSDYIQYHLYYRLPLMFSIKTGSFPLYMPYCYYGQSSAYLQPQLYHPLTYLVSWMPGYWGGYSLEWLTLFRLVSLALCHFFLFKLLRALALRHTMALLLSLVTIYNFNTLFHFWNSTALEAVTGLFFSCTAIGFYYLDPRKKHLPLLTIISLYWLLTSSYTPIVYFGAIGTVLFTAFFPFLHSSITGTPVDTKNLRRFWLKTGSFFLAGTLLASAFLLPFFLDYMLQSSGRVNQPYEWSTQLCDTAAGFVNNFFYPLASGFGVFGGTPLFLMAVVAPFVLKLFHVRVPAVIWAMIATVTAVFLHMQGARTPVHYWAWKYVPLLSAIRGPGRMSVILPVLFLLILIWVVSQHPSTFRLAGKQHRLFPLPAAAFSTLICLGIYALLPAGWVFNPHYSSPHNIREIPQWVKPAVLTANAAVLLALAAHPLSWRHCRIRPSGILASILLLAVLFRYGPPAITHRHNMPTFEQVLEQKQAAINFQPFYFLNQYGGSATVETQLKNYFMEPDLATIYRSHIHASSLAETYKILNSTRKADEVVIQGYQADGPSTGPPPLTDSCRDTVDRIVLSYSSYNRLVFSATACRPAFFVFSYPFSQHWRAWINEERAAIYRANGAAQAVRIPQGQSVIEFRYWSGAAVWGMVLSCTTLALLGCMAGFRSMRKPAGYWVAAAALTAGTLLFFLWFHSLYTGDNLQTRYTWETLPPSRLENMAFGKQAQMSSHRYGYPYLHGSRLAVDGGRTAASCFFTDRQNEPWWQVDLGAPEQVGRLVVYASGFSGETFNTLPLTISISEDGKHWRKARIDRLRVDDATQLVFQEPQVLRYLNIRAAGECILTLNEVEVYP